VSAENREVEHADGVRHQVPAFGVGKGNYQGVCGDDKRKTVVR
jgi:hypothetical protein